MILVLKSRKDYIDLLEVIRECPNEDFYLTRNNERVYITNSNTLNDLLKESHHIYFENEIDHKGIILVWKSFGGELKRNYIKMIASDVDTARRLLTILLWNYTEHLFVKIKKDSPLIAIFKEKGFKFTHGRGSQILLEKSKSFGEKINVSNHDKS